MATTINLLFFADTEYALVIDMHLFAFKYVEISGHVSSKGDLNYVALHHLLSVNVLHVSISYHLGLRRDVQHVVMKLFKFLTECHLQVCHHHSQSGECDH